VYPKLWQNQKTGKSGYSPACANEWVRRKPWSGGPRKFDERPDRMSRLGPGRTKDLRQGRQVHELQQQEIICEKPRVKCGECPNQAFLPVTAATVLDHLQGRHVIGVYPMLRDETCWFLAADFDKSCWREDVLAFMETCQRNNVPYAMSVPVQVTALMSGFSAAIRLLPQRPGKWAAI